LEIVVVWGGFGSLKVIGNVTIRWGTYEFLVDFNRTMRLSSTVFELYIASYLSKVANFNLPHLHLTPPLGWPPLSFGEIFGIIKL